MGFVGVQEEKEGAAGGTADPVHGLGKDLFRTPLGGLMVFAVNIESLVKAH